MFVITKRETTNTLLDKLDQLKARIEYTDEKINKLVFELYGWGEEKEINTLTRNVGSF